MSRPAVADTLELLKPITWFAPMWAFMCGVVSAGVPLDPMRAPLLGVGLLLAGPLICATSQAVNDWFDRHVDAINEPDRPIPSGRIPGRWGFYIALGWTALSLAAATLLGPVGFGAAVFGLLAAWAYSAPPTRLKRNGWWGNSAVAICYEGVPWFTGAAVAAAAMPDWRIVLVAFVYSVGAHGIMTLNDFKSVAGDTAMGLRSLPVILGTDRAARFACIVMSVPQVVVIALLIAWQQPLFAIAVTLLLAIQFLLMAKLLRAPREKAAWYNATGTTLYVLGMLITAVALRGIV